MLITHVYIYKNITAHQTGLYCRLTRCYSSVSIHRNRSDAHVKSGSLNRRQSLSYARRSDRYRRPTNPLNCFWVSIRSPLSVTVTVAATCENSEKLSGSTDEIAFVRDHKQIDSVISVGQ